MKEKKYQIECNEEQLRLISKSLELNSRMICGQIGESFSPPIQKALWKFKGDEYHKKYKIISEALNLVKKTLWGHDSNEHNGIGFDAEADLGYEMYKVIDYQFWNEHNDICLKEKKENINKYSTSSSLPLTLTKIPFIKIKKL